MSTQYSHQNYNHFHPRFLPHLPFPAPLSWSRASPLLLQMTKRLSHLQILSQGHPLPSGWHSSSLYALPGQKNQTDKNPLCHLFTGCTCDHRLDGSHYRARNHIQPGKIYLNWSPWSDMTHFCFVYKWFPHKFII